MVFVSCTKQTGESVNDSDKRFIAFFADYLIVQEENSIYSIDPTLARNRIDSIYTLHSYSRDEVDSLKVRYNHDLAKWQIIYERTIARIESLQTAFIKNSQKQK